MTEKCSDFEGRKSALVEEMAAVEVQCRAGGGAGVGVSDRFPLYPLAQDEMEGLEKRLQALRTRRAELVDGIAEQDREIALAKGSFEEEETAMKSVRDKVVKQQKELEQRQVRKQLLILFMYVCSVDVLASMSCEGRH